MKNTFLRLSLFSIVLFFGFSGPVWLFVCGMALYIFVYSGLEVIILAVAIDAYFGYASGGWFLYTIATTTGLFMMQWLRPYLSMYNQ